MSEQYYDSMAICRKFGKPDLFITMTCNPKWHEIQEHLLAHQTVSDRPDIVARVFKLKLEVINFFFFLHLVENESNHLEIENRLIKAIILHNAAWTDFD